MKLLRKMCGLLGPAWLVMFSAGPSINIIKHQHPRPDRDGLPAANVVTFNTVDPAGLKAVYRMAQNGFEKSTAF